MFEEQQNVCTSCGHKHKLTSHHKKPRMLSGSSEAWNLVGVCRPCHDRIHGVGPGCQQDCGYPDYITAAKACAAHWAIVMESWDRHRVSTGPGRGRIIPDPGFSSSGYFSGKLRDALALEEIEPRCT